MNQVVQTTHADTTASPKKLLKSLSISWTIRFAIAVDRKAFRASCACVSLSQAILSDQHSEPSYNSYATNPSISFRAVIIWLVSDRNSSRDELGLSLNLTICTCIVSVPNVETQGRCAVLSRSVSWSAGLEPVAHIPRKPTGSNNTH
jgi:hypothetical protein